MSHDPMALALTALVSPAISQAFLALDLRDNGYRRGSWVAGVLALVFNAMWVGVLGYSAWLKYGA